ncbi:hypothetical protein NCCP1664_06140 [Zafaria cholistanensis]|uniref:YtxH domain-containing protein n=1 Tax=Zafaria cholistanensis TaxID=1682741 RepID=A0A5A7NQ25_9MICC|nr:YtxH domain-containing protein [Zafaria cholistanensis]GER22117.1 hypothetical protein NCCP1664_06140 [Zafaria cholistanensis]
MRPLTFIVGASVGFLLGSRSGRETYDRIVASAQDFWRNPKTQEAVHHVEETVKAKAPEVGHAVAGAASTVKEKIQPSRRGQAEASQGSAAEASQGSAADIDQGYGGHTGLDRDTQAGANDLSVPASADEGDQAGEGGTAPGGPTAGL